MSGRRIDDHSSWVGAAKNGTVFPEGCKMKNETSSDSFGALAQYEDTSEAIKKQQMMNKTKVNGHPQKPGFRN